ncbi:N-acetylmuramidase domain-containing protein [Pseudomonas sp. 2835]|uniref:N-acetylmuramidase domain-containing protein n=1 Tax=Pseudomonas sp. 2835 TaxID=3156451 RepID=UPI003D1E8AEF
MTLTLRHGDRGQAVSQLQKQLNQAGAKPALVVDGDYGDATEKAVRAFQAKSGLVDDGIAGPKTQGALTGADCRKLLGNAALVAAAKRLGVELAAIYAVNEVESLGGGFLASGKPKILFERHVMYNRLALPQHEGDDAAALKRHADELAVSHPHLVNPRPGGYIGGAGEHQRLAQARMLDAQRADESASWGAFQVMGYHWQYLGYSSLADFVARMSRDENEHFEAFVRFIEADATLHKALKGKKWAQFAKLYNGPAYARNLYDVKLERAYERHADCGCTLDAA